MRSGAVGRLSGSGFRLRLFRRSRRRRGRGGRDRDLVLRPPDGDPRALLFDRDLRDPGLLHDADDLPDALGPRLVDVPTEQRLLAARAVADRAQERLGLVTEERQQEQLLLARREALRVLANVVELERLLDFLVRAGDERDGTLDGRVDRSRGRSELPLEQIAQLVDDRLVARCRENVDDRLRREDLADRARRPAASRPRRGSRSSSSRTSSRRSAAPCARSRVSIAATRPAGSSCWAARTAIRGASGVTGSSPTNSSTISAACQRTPMSTPLSIPAPASALAAASPETRCSVSAIG